MRYFNIVLLASLMLIMGILTCQPALAVADPFEPVQVALGPDGNVYAIVSGNESAVDHIFVFTPDGRLAKTIEARAVNIAFDAAGNLYASDFANNAIRKMDINGNVTGQWNYQAKPNIVIGCMAVSPDRKLYLSEFYIPPPYGTGDGAPFNDSRIFVLGENGTEQLVYVEKNLTNPPGGFHSMAIDANGTIYAVDTENAFKIISPDGAARIIGGLGTSDGKFNMITSISLGRDGYLYVTEYGNHRVQKLTTDGTFVQKWNGAGFDAFIYPYSAAADANGNVYVADTHNERIIWLTPQYTFGDRTTENLKGKGTTWGNVYQGTNYTTRLQEISEEKQATATPGFSPFVTLAGLAMTGAVLCFRRISMRR